MALRTQQHPVWGIKRKEGGRRKEGKITGRGVKRKEEEGGERRERDGFICDFIIR